MQDKIIINDYIEKDPLSEENLDTTLDLVNEIRLSSPKKSIWLYTGFTWEDIFREKSYVVNEPYNKRLNYIHATIKRRKITKQCDVLIDGRYIDSQRDITLPWRGSSNQRVINIKQSLQKGEIVLWA